MTLVEALVALGLLGLLAAGAAGLLPIMGRLATATAETQAVTQALSRSHDFLRTVIIQARPAADLGPGALPELLPMSPSQLRILTRLPEGLGPGGPVLLDLSVERLPDGLVRLSLKTMPLRPGSPATGTVLIEKAAHIEWSYYNAASRVWLPDWTSQSDLPALIRLRVSSQDTGDWPDLVVRPRLEQGLLCNFDLVSGKCRQEV